MSNYSFLKTGHNLVEPPKKFTKQEQENIMIMLSLFSSNALINGAKYCEICGRDGVTKEDLVYGMRYEVFEFLKRDNLMESMAEMAQDYHEEMKKNAEAEEYDEEVDDDDEIEEDEEEIEDDEDGLIVPDSEIQPFLRADTSKVKSEDKEFIDKMHQYYDNWDTWSPTTPLETILKSGIDKMI